MFAQLGGGGLSAGGVAYTTPGTYSWVAPSGCTAVCVVCVGAGGGGSSTTSVYLNGYGPLTGCQQPSLGEARYAWGSAGGASLNGGVGSGGSVGAVYTGMMKTGITVGSMGEFTDNSGGSISQVGGGPANGSVTGGFGCYPHKISCSAFAPSTDLADSYGWYDSTGVASDNKPSGMSYFGGHATVVSDATITPTMNGTNAFGGKYGGMTSCSVGSPLILSLPSPYYGGYASAPSVHGSCYATGGSPTILPKYHATSVSGYTYRCSSWYGIPSAGWSNSVNTVSGFTSTPSISSSHSGTISSASFSCDGIDHAITALTASGGSWLANPYITLTGGTLVSGGMSGKTAYGGTSTYQGDYVYGGGGGGALTYKNAITVTPGNSYTVVVGAGGGVNTGGGVSSFNGTVIANGGGGGASGAGGTGSGGDASGTGGAGATIGYSTYGDSWWQGGGGGAAGYGGNGGASIAGGTGASGASGGGGGGNGNGSYPGGGVGIFGMGANGSAGGGGSGGASGVGSTGGVAGGGGGGGGTGGRGAVRIIWGIGKTFPSNAA